jgi:hypothetical protein
VLRLLLSTALATLLASAPAFASDADVSAVAQGGTGAFIAGSASSPTDLRSGVAGEWDTAAGRFDWLWKLDAAPGTLDTLTDIVPAGPFVFAIGSANGALSVAKLDAATGTLQRPCGLTGIALHQFGTGLIPGRAVESGGRIFLAGATLGNPSRGVIAAIDESSCQVVGSRLVGGGQATGFSAVDAAISHPRRRGSSAPASAATSGPAPRSSTPPRPTGAPPLSRRSAASMPPRPHRGRG